ncbi:MAG: hypothetical protein JSV04_08285 [Candidatus Heimdallarchaeota archaeon]|nr:MAG: hypothetical protein JSV04_08285 [Candidatus Heimdallarchaeota archaeon]
MFAFDLPFLFFCGVILGYLMETRYITRKTNWFLGLSFLFIFQVGGMFLWFDGFPGSKEFMIIPFNLLGLTVNDFEPILTALLFGLEAPLLLIGEFLGLRQAAAGKN